MQSIKAFLVKIQKYNLLGIVIAIWLMLNGLAYILLLTSQEGFGIAPDRDVIDQFFDLLPGILVLLGSVGIILRNKIILYSALLLSFVGSIFSLYYGSLIFVDDALRLRFYIFAALYLIIELIYRKIIKKIPQTV